MAKDVLYVASCVHLGARGTNTDAFVKDLQLARRVGAKICLIGDLLDMGMFVGTGHSGSTYEQQITPNEQIDMACDILKPHRNHISVILQGNHEDRLRKATSVEANWQVATRLGIPRVYSDHYKVIKLGGKRVFMAHGVGKADFRKVSDGHEGNDVVALGHTHELSHSVGVKSTPGGGRRTVHLVRCGTYLREPRYGKVELYPPNPIGAAWITNQGGYVTVELGVR